MTDLELKAASNIYQDLLSMEFAREWGELDNCLYSLAQLDDEQIIKEVGQQLDKHCTTPPKCVLDHKHSKGHCKVTSLHAVAKYIFRDAVNQNLFLSDGERYLLENYLAHSHVEKAK